MKLNPYQSPMIAGQPVPEEQLSFRQQYWVEIVMVAEVLVLLSVILGHRLLWGTDLYAWLPIMLLVVAGWLVTLCMVLVVAIRAVYFAFLKRFKHAFACVFLLGIAVLALELADRLDIGMSQKVSYVVSFNRYYPRFLL